MIPYLLQEKIVSEKISNDEISNTLPATHSDLYPDSKVHLANMGPIWVLSAPDGSHVGPMNLAIRVVMP